ncbi:MAG TPA: P-loop NTPase [Phycisphaerales bacterium]|nr:P-loop NTPase [Phycisphaerales bacterium]
MSALPAIPTSDQATRLRRLVESGGPLPLRTTKRAKVLTISSGKGGVGKTNLAVNLAIALQARGVRTTLLDLDLGLANADLLCGLNPTGRIDRAFDDTPLEDLALLAPGGFRLIPGSVGLTHGSADGDSRVLARLHELDGCSDVLILDTGAGMGPTVRSAIHTADLALLLATPEPTSLADAYALLKVTCHSTASSPAQFVPMLVINQCASAEEAQEVHSRIAAVARRFLGRDFPLLGALPSDPALPQAVRDRRPLLLHTPASPAAMAVCASAEGVIARLGLQAAALPQRPTSRGVWHRLTRLIAARVD